MVELDFEKSNGLIPAVAQDWQTGEILMLAYISPESWAETLKSGCATYFSRSRNKLWKKGESSGHVQKIHSILVDCDLDTVVFKVEQLGSGACHTGHRSCFYREVDGETLRETEKPVFDADKVYQVKK
ncbi:MAG: phosphoribosyl-AMP cyclohydrolase [Lentisphaerae bacterium]|nr:phosphoribosyl-AMP cyclohydrolase [Lentisphaerota bacterium]MBQ4329913.1 phosphoribosyl-AMP cyclohydrolase [Lentisphaeria bacterium]MBR2720061.1 phosphoribosyl-AMP cyclohydrolase [Lentisphaeria bacterium]